MTAGPQHIQFRFKLLKWIRWFLVTALKALRLLMVTTTHVTDTCGGRCRTCGDTGNGARPARQFTAWSSTTEDLCALVRTHG